MRKLVICIILSALYSCNNQEDLTNFELTPSFERPVIQLPPNAKFKVAVIGAGVAGASATYFLQRELEDQVAISVYEKNNRVGGRTKNDMLGGGLIEQGATLIHSSNLYLLGMMEEYGLEAAIPHSGEGEVSTLAIWDGEDFRLNTSKNSFWSTMQILWRYGRDMPKLANLTKEMIPQWEMIYEKLNEGRAYRSPEELFKDIDLYELTQQTSYDYFASKDISDKLVKEFVDCISRVNYHQDGEVNAFVDMVSLAGAGLDGGTLLSVEGGNDLLSEHTFLKAPIDLRLNAPVTAIRLIGSEGQPQYAITDGSGRQDTFDIVIIACPLDLTDIDLPDFDIKKDRPYQTVHAHFIAGEVNHDYFGNPGNAPQTIFTVEDPAIPFISIAKTAFAPEWNVPIYKVFSRTELTDDFFDKAFINRKGHTHQYWKAYTVLNPTEDWPPFEIHKGLYYVNAMESVVSAMETEAIASRNVVNLAIDYMTQTKD